MRVLRMMNLGDGLSGLPLSFHLNYLLPQLQVAFLKLLWHINSVQLVYRRNRLRFVLPISSHVTIPLGSFSIILLFAFMAKLCMVRNMSEKSKEVLSRDSSHDMKWV